MPIRNIISMSIQRGNRSWQSSPGRVRGTASMDCESFSRTQHSGNFFDRKPRANRARIATSPEEASPNIAGNHRASPCAARDFCSNEVTKSCAAACQKNDRGVRVGEPGARFKQAFVVCARTHVANRANRKQSARAGLEQKNWLLTERSDSNVSRI